MAATLILVRHAAHVHLDKVLSGRTPGVPLSADGRAQAERLAERLAKRGLAAVQASPLDRARETARAIADAAGLTAETVEALNEIDLGAWSGRAFPDLHDDPEWRRWNEERATARPPGGESMAQAQARIVAHLDRLARERDGDAIVLVSHADTIRAAVSHALGLDLNGYWRFDVDPASATTLSWGEGWARLHRLNEGEG